MKMYVCVGRVEQKEKKNIEHHVSNRKYLEDNKPVKLYILFCVCMSKWSIFVFKICFWKKFIFFLLFHIWKLIWCRLFLANIQNYRNNVPHYLDLKMCNTYFGAVILFFVFYFAFVYTYYLCVDSLWARMLHEISFQ